MPGLCDKCDYLKRDGSCEICSREEQEYFADKDLCNFASVRGRAVTMTRNGYYRARRWYEKSEVKRVRT